MDDNPVPVDENANPPAPTVDPNAALVSTFLPADELPAGLRRMAPGSYVCLLVHRRKECGRIEYVLFPHRDDPTRMACLIKFVSVDTSDPGQAYNYGVALFESFVRWLFVIVFPEVMSVDMGVDLFLSGNMESEITRIHMTMLNVLIKKGMIVDGILPMPARENDPERGVLIFRLSTRVERNQQPPPEERAPLHSVVV